MYLTHKQNILFFFLSLFSGVLWIYFHSENTLIGDEGHYLKLAERLKAGYYTNKAELDLWYGPGYPLILALFSLISNNLFYLKAINAVFLSLSASILWSRYSSKVNRWVLTFALVFTFYNINNHKIVTQVITESFTLFLITNFAFIFLFHRNKKWGLIILAFLMAFLAITKVVFYYLWPIFILLAMIIMKSERKFVCKLAVSFFLLGLPYLIYTYNLTGKYFYPGTSGGSNLYWQASSSKPLMGEWHHTTDTQYFFQDQFAHLDKVALKKELNKHQVLFNQTLEMNPVERDLFLKRRAMNQIKENPVDFLRNTFFTFTRMLFSYPFTQYTGFIKLLLYLINGLIQMSILLFVFLRIFKSIQTVNVKNDQLLLFVFVILYLMIHLVLNGLARQYLVITPLILILAIESGLQINLWTKNK